MKLLVLGSCSGCHTAQGTRTQSALALSIDGESWVLLNTAPDLDHQLRVNPALQPRPGAADSPIKAVVLMDAQIEHVGGLLGLRDGPPLQLYATPCVFEDLSSGLPLLQTLQHYCGVRWHIVAVVGDTRAAEFQVAGFEALRFTAIATNGPAPSYATYRDGSTIGANIALFIEDRQTGQSLFYSPGPARLSARELAWMRRADCVLIDAGVEADDGDCGSAPGDADECAGTISASLLHTLQYMPNRKVLAHLCPGHPRRDLRSRLQQQGIELALDGLEIEL
jgi:pyrroloquinoline quinone biosynthesis protein B